MEIKDIVETKVGNQYAYTFFCEHCNQTRTVFQNGVSVKEILPVIIKELHISNDYDYIYKTVGGIIVDMELLPRLEDEEALPGGFVNYD